MALYNLHSPELNICLNKSLVLVLVKVFRRCLFHSALVPLILTVKIKWNNECEGNTKLKRCSNYRWIEATFTLSEIDYVSLLISIPSCFQHSAVTCVYILWLQHYDLMTFHWIILSFSEHLHQVDLLILALSTFSGSFTSQLRWNRH